MTALLQIAFDALSLGSLYAICALGIALIFGVMRLVNFAQGDYIAFCVFALLWPSIDATAIVFLGNLPWFVLVPVVLMFGAGISVASEILVFRRFRNANPATMMIASFAVGFVIQHVLLLLFSSRPKSINLWPALGLPVEILGARIPLLQLITIIITVAILIALTAFLRRTRYGLEMRAAAENFTMARMLGVRANRVIMLALGVSVMLVAFIATVIGGLGSLTGAVLAGYLIGAASVVMQVGLPLEARPFRDAFVYGAVIVSLIWRPQGLFAPNSTKQRI